jgi:tRNA nucleotidyltransferase (CCA-adding enzyme)
VAAPDAQSMVTTVARRAHAYPQIVLTAGDLVDTEVVTAPSSITAADALRLARRRRLRVLACGGAHVLVHDLARADSLGLGDLLARDLARPLPIVGARASELLVRRALSDGAPAVIVSGRGAIARPAAPRPLAVRARLAQALPSTTRALLAEIARVAAGQGARAFVVGGVVRDAWRGAATSGDLDIVVEGDGPSVARALADALGGTLIEHERFLTASVRAAAHGRVDVATARSERYEAPGALPRVLPASIGQDLQRRDFTVNAMAVEVTADAWELLDPFGGTVDLARRRLRVLHPLSFVEDPTRLLRAARYAARLELRADAWTARCRALALRLAPYAALSGQRIAVDLERLLEEPRASAALEWLVRGGIPRLLDPRWRMTRGTAARLVAVPATLAWVGAHRVVRPIVVAALALAGDQPSAVAESMAKRLGISGEPLSELRRALTEGAALARAVASATRSVAGRALRAASGAELAALHLLGGAARERVEWWVASGRAVEPMLSGYDVIEIGVTRGPSVAAALAAVRDARLDGRVVDRAAEIDYVRSWWSNHERKG